MKKLMECMGLALLSMVVLTAVLACDKSVPDNVLLEKAKQAVSAYQDVNIEVKAGVVTLTGSVDSAEVIKGLGDTVSKIVGIKSVNNQLQVKPKEVEPVEEPVEDPAEAPVEAPVGETLDDVAITAEVKNQLAQDKEVGALAIDVSTASQVVTLTGTVSTKEQSEKIAAVASQVRGVKEVNNQLAVKP